MTETLNGRQRNRTTEGIQMTTLHEAEIRNAIGLMKLEDSRNNFGNYKAAIQVLEAALAQQGEQQPEERIRLTDGEWPIIELGFGKVEVAEGWQGEVPALIFGRNGTGQVGEPTQPDRVHLAGETIAVVTFANVESLDVVAGKLATIRAERFAAAPAAQPACKQDLQVETEQERYVRMCPDSECGRKKQCTRIVGVSCMSRADIAAAPASHPDARKVIEQMVATLEVAKLWHQGDKWRNGTYEEREVWSAFRRDTGAAIAAGQKLLGELK